MRSPRLLHAKKFFFVYCLLLALVAGTSYLVVWGTSNEPDREDTGSRTSKFLPESD